MSPRCKGFLLYRILKINLPRVNVSSSIIAVQNYNATVRVVLKWFFQ